MTPIESIEAMDIPTRSASAAIAHLRNTGWCDRTGVINHKTLIHEISGVDPETDDERVLDYTFRYMVTTAIEDPDLRGQLLTDLAFTKALTFIESHAYVFAQPAGDTTPKLDAQGNVKPKKGAKKIMARKVYDEQIRNKEITRKAAIEILVAEVGLSPAGASTYYANLKKGVM